VKALVKPALALVLVVAMGGCSGCGNDAQNNGDDAGVGDAPPPFNACTADAQSFVRQAFVALIGRRPKSEAEADVYVDLYNAAQTKGLDPKDTVARAIMAEPEFAERWTQATMDAMHVQRYNIQNEATCWDHPTRSSVSPALATAVRDQLASGTGDGAAWNMADLASSAIALDDLTPLYRAQLFSMMTHPIPAANVPPVDAELARRADFGATFDAGFLHRDTVCLDCHNSQASVTMTDDPLTNRFWPVAGKPELGVYGAFDHINPDAAHTAFRVDTFLDGGSSRPWSWTSACGKFNPNVGTDPAVVNGRLGSVMGLTTTAYDLEKAMKHGFDALRGQAPPIVGDNPIADPDTALAWLITLKMTEDVWTEVQGTGLTIANYYPRNQASMELLQTLATHYTQSGYSLKALLSAVVSSDYFNRQTADQGCGASPYTYPNVYNPWVISDPDPAKRLNGPGDAVSAVDARTLVSALNGALEWGPPPAASRFPEYGDVDCEASCAEMQSECGGFGACCVAYQAACVQHGVSPTVEVPFERGVGMFLKNSDKGFRGIDFQARLVWENHENACTRPAWVTNDFIDKLLTAAAADSTTTAADLIAALKDRLVNEPAIDPGAETTALAGLVGDLNGAASAVTGAKLRLVCSALVQSPQFLLTGIAGRGGAVPKLTPANAGYDAVCADVAAHVSGATCSGKLALP
jgi:hypothetical protein